MLFNAIDKGVNSGDAFKLKEQLIRIVNSLSGFDQLSVRGVNTIEEIQKAIASEVPVNAMRDAENANKVAAARLILSILEGIEETNLYYKLKLTH